jgi:glycosyltransferase involved in cell wall biosynthesis
MNIAFITRSTIYSVPGGDTVQVSQTARCLRELGVLVDIYLTSDNIDYSRYDLFHYTNITRPADILYHIYRHSKPFVITPVLVDYSEFDKQYRKGISGLVLRRLSAGTNEYIKTTARWITRKDRLRSKNYLLRGQRNSIRKILREAAMLLPNSEMEYTRLESQYGIKKEYAVIPNGIDKKLFTPGNSNLRDKKMVLCAARIEGVKNQLNLIRALNNTDYILVLVGAASPNQAGYYAECRKIASHNIQFHDHVSQEKLISYYHKAKVHALPSWFETCGLSSLEAAAMGCNLSISSKGYTRDYFGEEAFYCEPGDPDSIYQSIHAAANTECNKKFQEKIIDQYTWDRAAILTLEAYKKILST